LAVVTDSSLSPPAGTEEPLLFSRKVEAIQRGLPSLIRIRGSMEEDLPFVIMMVHEWIRGRMPSLITMENKRIRAGPPSLILMANKVIRRKSVIFLIMMVDKSIRAGKSAISDTDGE
jgi:hypothetical protein